MIIAILAGCAECEGGDPEPLVVIETEPAKRLTMDQAKDLYFDANGIADWSEHPQGGFHLKSSSGSVWLIELPDRP